MNQVVQIKEAATDADLIRVLGSSTFPGAKPESIAMALAYCRAQKVDPIQKAVHIVPMSVKKPGTRDYEWRDVIMPGIGLYRIQATRTGAYMGKTEPVYGPMVTKKLGGVDVTYPETCSITVKRMVQGVICEWTATEDWLENYATAGKDTDAPNAMWRKRAKAQLAKCAEAQALRMAFPDVIGGVTADEMEGKMTFDEGEPLPDGMQVVPNEKEKHTAQKQLDAFATKSASEKAAEITRSNKELEGADPETGEIIEPDKLPVMPAEFKEAWDQKKLFKKAWLWIANTLPNVPKDRKEAFARQYIDILRAVNGYSVDFSSDLEMLLKDQGVKIEI